MESLEKLYEQYRLYLQECVNVLVENKISNLNRSEYKNLFPKSNVLITTISQCCQHHAVNILISWFSSNYTNKVKSKIKYLIKEKKITKEYSKKLFTIGKYNISKPYKDITKEDINYYWDILLKYCKTPNISKKVGIKTTYLTSVLKENDNKLSNLWVGISVLNKGKRTYLPLKGNPFIKNKNEVAKSLLINKDKLGRWYIQAVENKEYEIPKLPENYNKITVDVGLNTLAATSDGRLYGVKFKKPFDYKYNKIKSIRANRQRQNLKENSKRLDKLEYKLSEFIKSSVGNITNKLVKDYPNTLFIVEDLDLQGSRGQKRFAYNKLINSLKTKANIEKVNPAFTSQVCTSCNYLNKNNRKGTKFICKSCGKISHSDIVGARNLFRRSEQIEISCDISVSEVEDYLRKQYVYFRNRNTESFLNNKKKSCIACNHKLTDTS